MHVQSLFLNLMAETHYSPKEYIAIDCVVLTIQSNEKPMQLVATQKSVSSAL